MKITWGGIMAGGAWP